MVIAGGGKEPIEIGLRAQPYRDGDEFGDIVGVEFAQAQFDRGKKVCARLDEHQGFGWLSLSLIAVGIRFELEK